MSTGSNFDDEEDGFFRRHAVKMIMGVLVVAGVGYFAKNTKLEETKPKPKAEPSLVRISLPPPAPPPPPPPPPPPQKQIEQPKQEMVEQTPVNEPEEKPDDSPPDDPGPAVTSSGPPGNDAFGLRGGKGGGGGSGLGGSRKSNSKWGWYAGQVQNKISDALRNHSKTKKASMRLEVRVWPDNTGRITKASLAGTTGDSAMDSAIKNEILTGMQLQEPPPADMPRPIVLRVTAKRPN